MLIATQPKSIAATQKYFDTVLTQGDYYLGAEVNGAWRGKGAKLLDLEEGETVTREPFAHPLAGLQPTTGKKLLQRLRKDRRHSGRRRPGRYRRRRPRVQHRRRRQPDERRFELIGLTLTSTDGDQHASQLLSAKALAQLGGDGVNDLVLSL